MILLARIFIEREYLLNRSFTYVPLVVCESFHQHCITYTLLKYPFKTLSDEKSICNINSLKLLIIHSSVALSNYIIKN